MNSTSSVTSTTMGHEMSNSYRTYVVPTSVYISLGVIEALTGIFGSLLNGAVLFLFFKTKELRSPTSVFIINLAISDFLMCVLAIPWSTVSNFAYEWLWGDVGCEIEGFLVYFLGLTNIFSLCAISVDRYIVIAKPKSRKMSRKVAVSCWAAGLFWSVCPLVGWSHYRLEGIMTSCSIAFKTDSLSEKSYIVAIFVFCFLVPIAVMIFSYVHVYLTFRNASRNKVWGNSSAVSRRNMTIEKRLAKTIICIIGVFWLTWMPYAIVSFWSAFGDASAIPIYVAASTPFIAKCSCIANPIIYAATNKQICTAFYRVFPCKNVESRVENRIEKDLTNMVDVNVSTTRGLPTGTKICEQQDRKSDDKKAFQIPMHSPMSVTPIDSTEILL